MRDYTYIFFLKREASNMSYSQDFSPTNKYHIFNIQLELVTGPSATKH